MISASLLIVVLAAMPAEAIPATYSVSPTTHETVIARTRVLDGDDDCVAIALPTPFTFYRISFTTIFVSTNGYITFDNCVTNFSRLFRRFQIHPEIAVRPNDLFCESAPQGVYVDSDSRVPATPYSPLGRAAVVTWFCRNFNATPGIVTAFMTAELHYGSNAIILRYYQISPNQGTNNFLFAGVSAGDAPCCSTSIFNFPPGPDNWQRTFFVQGEGQSFILLPLPP